MSDQQTPENNASEDEPAKKSGKGKLIVLAVVAVLLIGGGVLAVSMFSGGEEQVEMVERSTEAAPAPKPIYVNIERLPAAVTDSEGRTIGYVFLDISLELTGAEEQAFVTDRLPRIRDAFLRSISKDGISRPDEPGVIDFEGVGQRFKDTANAVLGREVIQQVLIPRALRGP